MSLAQPFFDLFRTSEQGYGVYRFAPDASPNAKGKIEGRGQTIHQPVKLVNWQHHLDGTQALGVSPILPDSTSTWGAIDLDIYPIDLAMMAKRVTTIKLPLIVVRSKSGGAHLYCFLTQPIPAQKLRRKLKEWAIALGADENVEIFPKQDAFVEDSVGSWINLPYFGGETTNRYAFNDEGISVGCQEFLELAQTKSIDIDVFLKTTPTPIQQPKQEAQPQYAIIDDPTDPLSPFRNGFACTIPLLQSGVHMSMRNESMYHMGLQAKLKYGEGSVTDKLNEWNRQFFSHNPFTQREISILASSVKKKAYRPKCKQAPIGQFCNFNACQMQPFGISEAGMQTAKSQDSSIKFDDLEINDLTKINSDPVIWRWTINGKTIEVNSHELLSQAAFLTKILDVTSLVVAPLQAQKWRGMIAAHTIKAPVVEVPDDAKKTGQINHWVDKYFTTRVISTAMDELAADRTVLYEGRLLFIPAELESWLKQQKVEGISTRVLWNVLESRGVFAGNEVIKGKKVSYWSIPKLDEQVEELTVPREIEDDPLF